MNDDPPNVLLLFALGAATDLLWVGATRATVEGQPKRAALYNMALAAIALGSTWSVISHQSLLEAAAYILGCGLGTFLSVKPHEPR